MSTTPQDPASALRDLLESAECLKEQLDGVVGYSGEPSSFKAAREAIASAPSIPTWRPITEKDKDQDAILTEEGWVTWLSGDSATYWNRDEGWFLSDGCNLITCEDNGPFRCSPKFTIDPPKI